MAPWRAAREKASKLLDGPRTMLCVHLEAHDAGDGRVTYRSTESRNLMGVRGSTPVYEVKYLIVHLGSEQHAGWQPRQEDPESPWAAHAVGA
jgi:hypothetical protein